MRGGSARKKRRRGPRTTRFAHLDIGLKDLQEALELLVREKAQGLRGEGAAVLGAPRLQDPHATG